MAACGSAYQDTGWRAEAADDWMVDPVICLILDVVNLLQLQSGRFVNQIQIQKLHLANEAPGWSMVLLVSAVKVLR